MGPQKQNIEPSLSRFDRVNHTIKKATETYFNRPSYYLFYALLTGGSVALLFNFELPWQFYILIGALGLTQLYQWAEFEKPKVKPKKNSGKQRTTVQ